MICDDCKLVSICGRHISCNPIKVKSCRMYKQRKINMKHGNLTDTRCPCCGQFLTENDGKLTCTCCGYRASN